MNDLHHKIALVTTLLPQVVTANKTGIGVDRQGFGSVEHLVHLGAPGDTLSGALKFSQIYKIGYRGNKQFSRVTITKTGTHTNGTPIGMMAVKGHPQLAPTA
jgi:hypothetical protein